MNSDVADTFFPRTLVLLNALLGTFSYVYSEIMFTMYHFIFPKITKWGVGLNKSGGKV